MGKWVSSPNIIPLTRDYLEDTLLTYSRNGWAKTQWLELAERLLDEGFTLLLYEDRGRKWRHFRVTRVGNPLQLKVGLFYGDDEPPVVSIGCDILVRRGGTKPSEALQGILSAYAPDVDRLEYAEYEEVPL